MQTFHRWRNQYGACKADNVKRLKFLEFEQPSSACCRFLIRIYSPRGSVACRPRVRLSAVRLLRRFGRKPSGTKRGTAVW